MEKSKQTENNIQTQNVKIFNSFGYFCLTFIPINSNGRTLNKTNEFSDLITGLNKNELRLCTSLWLANG